MANPRRAIALHVQTQPPPLPTSAAALPPHSSLASSLLHFLKRPASFPFLLSLFVLLTWLSLRFHRPSPPPSLGGRPTVVHDPQANLVRFPAELHPTPIARDGRGWLLDPVAAARDASGVAVELDEEARPRVKASSEWILGCIAHGGDIYGGTSQRRTKDRPAL